MFYLYKICCIYILDILTVLSILDKECRENLLKNVKKEVKHLMEVSVTKKVIHEDNSCIISLCGKLIIK